MSAPSTPKPSFIASAQPHAIALFRVVTGLLFACHGAAKLFGVLGGATGSGDTAPTGAWPMWFAAVIELVAGALVVLGLGTRFAALISSGAMAYAYFSMHHGQALWPIQNQGEPAALYSWAFFVLIFIGPGAWSLDQLFARGSGANTSAADGAASTAERTTAGV